MSPTKTYAGGCFTLLSIAVACLAAAFVMIVDCVSGPSDCPTDDERKLWLAGILVATVALNTLLWFVLARRPKE